MNPRSDWRACLRLASASVLILGCGSTLTQVTTFQCVAEGQPPPSDCALLQVVARDPAGNLRPAKDKSTERIDGIVALIMAVGRAMLPTEQPPRSVDEDRGLLIL